MTDDNRTKILDLAVAAIDAGGESAIRVNHIVAEVGVTPPVLYYHFGSREGLVIAAQIERFTKQGFADLEVIDQAISACTTRDELHDVMRTAWRNVIQGRGPTRWTRMSVIGSAYARPELVAAIARAQDDFILEMVRMVEPSRERGWLRPGIDLASAFAWQHAVLLSRVLVEQGEKQVDLDEWDRLTLESFERVFFGD